MSSVSDKIHVVSLGVGNVITLAQPTKDLICNAQILIGAEHHFTLIEKLSLDTSNATKILFPSPFKNLENLIQSNIDKRVVVLASGDALFYGVGQFLCKTIGRDKIIFHPNVSSMQVAFHRVGLPWQDAIIHSLHGRSLDTLNRCIHNKALIGLFTDERSNPTAIAKHLIELGFGESELWVCENLGANNEVVQCYSANELENVTTDFAVLTICIVKCQGYNDCLQGVSGIADECFETGSEPGKGMISKREVRLSILSLMESYPNDIAWDVGSGCGSVSIEWARLNSTATIYAIENNPQRMSYLKINAKKFGVELNLKPILDDAPKACENLPAPDVIFIGGNGGDLLALLEYCMAHLKVGGRLVTSAVVDKSIDALKIFAKLHSDNKGELIEISVNKISDLSNINSLRELKTVTLLKVVK